MSTRSRAELKGFFKTNAIPTQSNFEDLIDSALNQTDDGLVRLPNDALTVNAAGPEQTLLRFSSVGASGSTPAWLVKQNPATASTAGLVFQDAGNLANVLFIQSGTTGNVGVGTLAPAAKLDVQGAGGSNIDLNVNGRLRSNNPDGGLWVSGDRFIGGSSAGLVGFAGNTDNWWLAVLNNGNVGIGTTTPVARLDVQGAGGTNIDLNVNGRLCSNSADGGLWMTNGGGFVGGFSSGAGNQVGFYNGGWRVAVQPNGYVGIGTQTASAPLEVAGNLKVTGGAITPCVGFDGNSGINWPENAYGGAGDAAWIRYHNVARSFGFGGGPFGRIGIPNENCTLEIGISDNPDDNISLVASGTVSIANGRLTMGAWDLVATGNQFFIKYNGSPVARFAAGVAVDRFNVFANPNPNGVGPYFYYNNGNLTSTFPGGTAPP